jgi:hypothetical protein
MNLPLLNHFIDPAGELWELDDFQRLDAPPKKAKISWRAHERRICEWYYNGHQVRNLMCFSSLRRIRRVRRRYNEDLINRGVLPPFELSPVTTKGVVDAVYHKHRNFLYIGETMRSAMDRFKEHVRAVLRWKQTGKASDGYPLARAIARFGWENFGTFPLEHIPGTFQPGTKPGRRDFEVISKVREKFWIERLHTWVKEGGFNGTDAGKWAKPRPKVRHARNPLMYERAVPAVALQRARNRLFGTDDPVRRVGAAWLPLPPPPSPAVDKRTWFKDSIRRIRYVASLLQKNIFFG